MMSLSRLTSIQWLLALLAVTAVIAVPTHSPDKYPVILVPGFGGCRAYVRERNESTAEWRILWLDLKDFFTPRATTERFRLRYDRIRHRVLDNADYEVIFPGLGDTVNVEYLDPNEHWFGDYFSSIVDYLKRDPFFRSNVTLRSVPYDFRKSPNYNPKFLSDARRLVEDTYAINGRRRVVLVAHSYGTLYTHWFLNSQTPGWNKKHIKAFVSLSGPYGGTMKATKALASGDNVGAFMFNPLLFRELQRTMPALALMLPRAEIWPAQVPIVLTPERNYTVRDMEQLFTDMNFTDGYDMMRVTQNALHFTQSPRGVDEVYCVYGTGVPTAEQLIYEAPSMFRSAFPDQTPTIITGDGDGSVNSRSLQLCDRWKNAVRIPLPAGEHMEVVRDLRVFELVARVAGAVVDK